jgi:hypothetical protein
MIKFLEWLKCIGMNVNVNLYSGYQDFINECNSYNSLMSDLTVGIDYVDQFMESIYEFKILALCTTKYEGHVVSLRTDGIPFFDRQLNYHFEIYGNDNDPCDNMIKYYVKKLELEKLYSELNDNEILVPTEGHLDPFSHIKNVDKEIIKNDKVYKECGMTFSANGSFIMYQTSEYSELKKQVELQEWEMYSLFEEKSKSCNYIHNLHGTYRILFDMIVSIVKDRFTSLF